MKIHGGIQRMRPLPQPKFQLVRRKTKAEVCSEGTKDISYKAHSG